MNAPFQIEFNNLKEIRMGSPYKSCDIKFINNIKLKLPLATWQNKYAWSKDFKILFLVKWNFENNSPGFHFFLINIISGKSWESDKIAGLLNEFSIVANKLKINSFLFDKEKSKTKLCCNIVTELSIPSIS